MPVTLHSPAGRASINQECSTAGYAGDSTVRRLLHCGRHRPGDEIRIRPQNDTQTSSMHKLQVPTAGTKSVLLVVSLEGINVCVPEGKDIYMSHALRRISYATC